MISMLADGDIRTALSSIESAAYFRGKHEGILSADCRNRWKDLFGSMQSEAAGLEIDADGFRIAR